MRRNSICALAASAITVIAMAGLSTGTAHAVELYPDAAPPRMVLVIPAPEPQPVRLIVRTPPRTRVILRVSEVDDGSRESTARAPSPDAPRLVLGGGIGPMFVISDPSHSLVPMGQVHAGVSVSNLEFGLRIGIAPYAATLTNIDGTATDAGLYTTDVTFTYRFMPDADVHPVLGAGVGAVIATQGGAAPAAGFGVSLRAGLELGVPVDEGELGLGLDALGTQVVGAEDGFPWVLATTLTIGAHLDYRF